MRRLWGSVVAVFALVAGGVLVASPALAADFTFDDSPVTVPVHVDGRIESRTIPVSGAGTIADVDITLDFHKVNGTCAVPGESFPYNNEIGFVLTSPEGTTVTLVQHFPNTPTTYQAWGQGGRVQVTLDDDAAQAVGVGGVPATGTFQPFQPLSAFNGEDPNGTWTLDVIDSLGVDPLCYYGAELKISVASTTTTTVIASPNPLVVGTSTTLTATVTGAAPTGTVQFYRGATSLGTSALVNGEAALPVVTADIAESYTVTAEYSGDANNSASTSAPYTITVEPFISTTDLTVSANPVTEGEETVLAATVTGFNPAGDVEFFADATSLGIAPLAGGVASLPVSTLPVGIHQITAVYAGDGGNTGSTSAVTTLIVNPSTVGPAPVTPPSQTGSVRSTSQTSSATQEIARTGDDGLSLLAPLGILAALAGAALLFRRSEQTKARP